MSGGADEEKQRDEVTLKRGRRKRLREEKMRREEWSGRGGVGGGGHLHAHHLGELVGHVQVQRHTGEYTASLGSKGSEDRWHGGRISETGLLTRRMRLNAADTSLKYTHMHKTLPPVL